VDAEARQTMVEVVVVVVVVVVHVAILARTHDLTQDHHVS